MAKQSLENLKFETANALGIDYKVGDKGNIPARQHGYVGGNMVKRLVELGEQSLNQTQNITRMK